MNILSTGSGHIYMAAWGSELPTDLSAPGDDWTDVGLISEDGMHEVYTPQFLTRRHWNAVTSNVQLPAGYEHLIEFTPLEYSEFVTVLEYGGGTWTEDSGVRRFDPPSRMTVPAWSLICDALDEGRTVRTVIERCQVVSPVDHTFKAEVTRSLIQLALTSAAGTAPWWKLDSLVLE